RGEGFDEDYFGAGAGPVVDAVADVAGERVAADDEQVIHRAGQRWGVVPGDVVLIVPAGVTGVHQVEVRSNRPSRVNPDGQRAADDADVAGLVFGRGSNLVGAVGQRVGGDLPVAQAVARHAVGEVGTDRRLADDDAVGPEDDPGVGLRGPLEGGRG